MRSDDRLLIPITYGFSVRYLVPTGILDSLSEVCTPVVGLGWDDAELEAELKARGCEVVRLPDPLLDHTYRMYRRRLAVVHERRLASPTSRIRRTRDLRSFESSRARRIASARRWRDDALLRLPGAMDSVEAEEPAAIAAGTNVVDFDAFLAAERIDAVLSVTPYHDQDGLLLWAARERTLPSITAIISFDNPTTRARMITRSELILVWNRHNREELLRSYEDLEPAQVAVIGAPQFDLHHRPGLVLDRDTWCDAVGVPRDRPIILHGAVPQNLVPGEPKLVELVDRLIHSGRVADEPYLLVRRHPVDRPEHWEDLALRHGHVVDPWAAGRNPFRGWPTQSDVELQLSSLAHAAVHINICSSMTLDGAVFDRPQIGPAFVPGATRSELRQVRELYDQEHWLPIARSGGLAPARDEAELVRSISEGLNDPALRRPGRAHMVQDVLTHDDGRSSERLVGHVAAF